MWYQNCQAAKVLNKHFKTQNVAYRICTLSTKTIMHDGLSCETVIRVAEEEPSYVYEEQSFMLYINDLKKYY